VRDRICAAALALAQAAGYTNAGTVEFLVAGELGSEEVFFLEMNTRLQVEHPVTEHAVGVHGEPLDLVDLQLAIAAGEPLPFGQDEVKVIGHAIEARVYAEDAFGGFLPQAGQASLVRWPEGPGTRVDAALEPEQTVTTAYDPMLGKVIGHGPDREAARRALVDALDRTGILGLTTNTGFVRALAASDVFRDGDVDTAWLDRNEVPAPGDELPRVVAAWTDAFVTRISAAPGPFAPDGWRLGGDPAPLRVELDRPLLVDLADGTVTDGDTVHQVTHHDAALHVIRLDVDDQPVTAFVNAQAGFVDVGWQGQRFCFTRRDPFSLAAGGVSDGTLTAPMPGTVLAVQVSEGDEVQEGQVLGTMEAMKMELALRSPFAGVVSRVGAAAGDQVALGTELFHVEPADETS
jgi:acetyl/propionyl-CoA carboxylase alpha subunit